MRRSDYQQSRQRLIAAAGALFASVGRDVSLVDIAHQARLSVATAYRHFDGVDQVVDAYRHSVISKLADFVDQAIQAGSLTFDGVNEYWVRLVIDHGPALVHHRSPEGFLDRLQRDEGGPSRQVRTLRLPLAQVIEELNLEGSDSVEITAAQLWNILFDPREVLDLKGSLNLDQPAIALRLGATFRGALKGWYTARDSGCTDHIKAIGAAASDA